MTPPPPPRLSITTCTPSTSVSLLTTMRATVSLAPPAGFGDIRRIGCVGKSCAHAPLAITPIASNARAVLPASRFPPLASRISGFKRQPDCLSSGRRALDRYGGFERDARLLRRRVHSRRTGNQVVEPRACFVAE